MRLLLVEDNEELAGLIERGLRQNGFVIDSTSLADEAKTALAIARYNAVILDLGLPDEDGLAVLSHLRDRGDPTPVLILTARDGLEDRVRGLNSGADDYVLKPFEMAELVARVKALLRRPGNALGTVLRIGNVQFDTISRQTTVDEQPLSLTRRESDVLEHLMRRAQRVVTKTMLEEELYGFNESVGSNSVEVAVHRLRKTLADARAGLHIHTLRGVGYLLSDKPVPSP